ncbi:AtpZ/AtpI family protein [Rubrobacter aplysinae]|uniref:AtpZ/AtpI family protein n=1 Tax=Rubrobacter aplysinae TaxID=909625 RepID=UPI00064BF6CD|nr:AtpZ/AtpI family protein [Rubrobacter aplysinae]
MANSDSRTNRGSGYARLIGVGFSFFMIIVGLSAGGFLIDRVLDTLPLFMLVGLVAGFALGMLYIYFAIKKMEEERGR